MSVNKIIIHCGINTWEKSSYSLFWPVLTPTPLAYTWALPPENKNFSLIFTSVVSANIFFKNFKGGFKSNLNHICAVGQKTANYIKNILPQYSVVTPAHNDEGLYPLLTQTQFTKNSIVYVFTALNGKSGNTIQNVEQLNLGFSIQPVFLYQLDPFKNNFLNSLFTQYNLQNTSMEFVCNSGMVLTTAVNFLEKYFGVNFKNFHTHIAFTATKESARQALDTFKK